MAKIIPITQNPERYSELANTWQVSASPNIEPLTINKGIPITGIKPILSVDGIIVKADQWYLCSQSTLDALKESRNPHYSIETNGPINWGTASVDLGRTIRLVEVNVENLIQQADELDIKNRKAGVAFVDYLFEGETIDGVPVNLIRQIDYTLSAEKQRPEDTWGVYELNLGDAETIYSVTALNIDTRQEDGSLDKGKLETFLTDIGARLSVLRSDFNTIKGVFYNGEVPDSTVIIPITNQAQTVSDEDEFPVLFKYTQLVGVQGNTSNTTGTPTNVTIPTTPPASPTDPTTTTPPVVELQMRKRRDLRSNSIPVLESDPSVTGPSRFSNRTVRVIREGDKFFGYFLKDWEHGQKIWVVYDVDKTTLVGYGLADKNDFVDPV